MKKVIAGLSVISIVIILFSFETTEQTPLAAKLAKVSEAEDLSTVEMFDKNHPFVKYANNPSVIESARQMEARYGIPMEFHIIQGALESYGGRSRIAKLAGNHFGVKCWQKHNHKKAGCVWSNTDKAWFEYHGKGAWVTYKKHSEFLKRNERYASAFKCNEKYTDLRELNNCWCDEVAKAGYAHGPKAHEKYRDEYAEKLKAYIIKAGMYDNSKFAVSRMGPQETFTPKTGKVSTPKKSPVKPPVKRPPTEQEKILWYLQGQSLINKYGGKEYGIK